MDTEYALRARRADEAKGWEVWRITVYMKQGNFAGATAAHDRVYSTPNAKREKWRTGRFTAERKT